MKTYKITFFDSRLNTDRETHIYETSAQQAGANFIFKNPEYFILNIEEI